MGTGSIIHRKLMQRVRSDATLKMFLEKGTDKHIDLWGHTLIMI